MAETAVENSISTGPTTAPTDAAAATASPAVAPVLFKARGRAKGKAKANLRKRSPSPAKAARNKDSDSDSSDSSDGGNSDSEGDSSRRGTMPMLKKRRRGGAGSSLNSASTAPVKSATADSASKAPEFFADRSALLADTDTATRRSHVLDEEKASALKSRPGADKKTRAVGPVRAAASVRTITVTDFTPDVCKDYKQTGFCGFGDSCKFLHAREDYKQGWQLDNEWDAAIKGKKNLGGTIVASADRHLNKGDRAGGGDDDDDDDEAMLRDIPFVCLICRERYKEPVITRCGHYFCERCALQRYRRDPTCAACGVATTGVFNNAKRLAKLLERKRERAAKRRQAAIEAGEEASEAEEGEVEGGEESE